MDLLADPTSSFAYPRAFLLLRYLHVQDLPAPVVGTVQAAIWMATVIFVLQPRSFFRAILTTAIFFAPPYVLGLEQGNVDMALFVLMTGAAVLWSRSTSLGHTLWPVAAALFAAFLKMYPAFVLAGGAWTETGRRRLLWVGAMVTVGSYWAVNPEEIRLVMSKFDLGNGSSWGCLLIFSKTFLFNIPHLWLVAVIVYSAAFLVAVTVGSLFSGRFRDCTLERKEWAFYWFGASICCGAFLTTNYDYRWVHALLTVPLLLRTVRTRSLVPFLWAFVTMIALGISLSFPLYLHPLRKPFMIVQVANWTYVLLLAFGFVAMRPHYITGNAAAAQPETAA